jgi:cell division protein FtsL
MKEISYISYSSTVKGSKKNRLGSGMMSFIASIIPVVIVCAILVTAGVVHLYVRNQVLKYSYLVPQENRKQKLLIEENKSLKSQYSSLVSPARIEKYAIEKLNMRYPEPKDIIIVEESIVKKYIGQSE